MPQPGDVLRGKYRLLRLLGEGGMGQVFEAQHVHTGRHFAIKALHAAMLGNHTTLLRFLQEARACARIGHPNIVEVYDLEMDDTGTWPFIVQELLQGQTLAQALDERPSQRFEPSEALRIMVPLMGALVGAHRRGVVHRDLKPANLFLSLGAGGAVVPKIIDFGVAKVRADADATVLTATGLLVGSPEYMSPEQVAGDRSVDAQSDVWSIGVVLYEVLTGHLPYESATAQVVMAKILHEDPTPIHTWNPALPADLVAVVHRALERDRARRFPSMQSFVEALIESSAWSRDADTIPDFNTTDHAVGGDVSAGPDAVTLVMPEPTARRPTARWQPPWWVLALGAALVAIVAALVGHAVGSSGR